MPAICLIAFNHVPLICAKLHGGSTFVGHMAALA